MVNIQNENINGNIFVYFSTLLSLWNIFVRPKECRNLRFSIGGSRM